MKALSTTKMSSKGQIVIPEEIRNSLGLHSGDKFLVVSKQGVIILKMIEEPKLDKFDHLIKLAKKQAKEDKIKKSDVKSAIREARHKYK